MIALWMSVALAVGPGVLDEDQGWNELGSRKADVGVVLVRRKVVDGVTCLEGAVEVETSVDRLFSVTQDMASARRWSSATLLVSEEIERTGSAYTVFQYFDVPGWTMAADRYWVIRGQAVRESGVARFRWNRVPASADVVARADALGRSPVEPPVNFGEWRFVDDGSTTRVRYRSCADMGGSLPVSLQTWVATQQLPQTISDLVREAERR